MKIPDQVAALLGRLSPSAICDRCLGDAAGLSDHHEAEAAARALVGKDGYERRRDVCAMCGAAGPVTRKNRKGR